MTAGGDPPVAPETQTLTFETADPYTVEAEEMASIVLDGAQPAFPLADAVANLRVMEQIFRIGDEGA
jgi:predicted dehydrogenase